MNSFKENAVAVLVVLMLSSWYIFTGYLLVDYMKLHVIYLLLGGGILILLLATVLKTMDIMKKQKY